MKIFVNLILVILVLLAVSSGITKVLLMPQDVQFFGEFGFTNPALIAFGALQVLGSVLLAIPRSRIWGAALIAVTFLVSAVLLFMGGSLPVAFITMACVVLLGFVAQQSRKSKA
jgi:uncharacterized membrane protein YphA (DoxX/SURF4 family)